MRPPQLKKILREPPKAREILSFAACVWDVGTVDTRSLSQRVVLAFFLAGTFQKVPHGMENSPLRAKAVCELALCFSPTDFHLASLSPRSLITRAKVRFVSLCGQVLRVPDQKHAKLQHPFIDRYWASQRTVYNNHNHILSLKSF